MILTRQKLEDREKSFLAPYAVLSSSSEGRVHREPNDAFRTCFQHDRDRIIHSKAFRRLERKTQVFTGPSGDHFRDRMIHSVEVAQISRGISRTLGLNEDLSEAIALAHDLGHPPFGHSGEFALNEVMQTFGLRFEHNEQSKRIVETLEKISTDFDGLNLTKEVLDGLLKHHTPWDQPLTEFKLWPHLEGQVVNVADEIAYTAHDIDDGLRAKLFTREDLGAFEIWKISGASVSDVVRFLINDLITQTEKNLNSKRISTLSNVKNFQGVLVSFSDGVKEYLTAVRAFLVARFYLSEPVKSSLSRGQDMIKEVFFAYHRKPEFLPAKIRARVDRDDSKEVVIKDYIAGMTDRFLAKEYDKMKLHGVSKM